MYLNTEYRFVDRDGHVVPRIEDDLKDCNWMLDRLEMGSLKMQPVRTPNPRLVKAAQIAAFWQLAYDAGEKADVGHYRSPINAIKMIRHLTGSDLKEAKDFWDEHCKNEDRK